MAFLARRLLLGVGVLAAVSYGTFVLIATHFSATCMSVYTPTRQFPPLAANAADATKLYWTWVKGIPSGASLGPICGGEGLRAQVWPAFLHTAALLAGTALVVVIFALALGTLAAARAGSWLDVVLRTIFYALWAVPAFVLALVLQSVFHWASARYGFNWFGLAGWPASCLGPSGNFYPCGPAGSTTHHLLEVVRHLVLPTVALAVAFIGLHGRYLRSSLLVALNAPYATTARAKGLPERRVIIRHALRNSLATFVSALLLDFGAIFGAAMAVDWVFQLNGLGTLFITELGTGGTGDAPKFLNPYAVETLLATAAAIPIAASLLAEVCVAWLDPRMRLR